VITDDLKSGFFRAKRGDPLSPIGLLMIPILVHLSLYVDPLLGNDHEINSCTIAVAS
jgi:hypothetical protein